MLVLTVMFMDSVLEYKPIQMPFGTMMAASFVFPLWFFLTDVITEVYGAKIAKKVLWSAFTCQLIVSLTASLLVAWLKDTENLHEAYEINPLQQKPS